jgi:signal transduction histidine kinase
MGGLTRTAWLRTALPWTAGGAAAAWALWGAFSAWGRVPAWAVVVTQPIGLFLIGVGVFAWTRWAVGSVRMGLLLIAAGATWYFGSLELVAGPVLPRLGFWFLHLHSVFLAHVLLAYPDGRLSRPVHRLVIGALYVSTLVTQGMRMLAEDPLPPHLWGDPAARNSVWSPVGSVTAGLLAVVVVALLVQRWRAETPAGRRARAPFWISAAMIGLVVLAGTVVALFRAPPPVPGMVLVLYSLSLVLLGVAALYGVLRTRFSERALRQALALVHDGSLRDGLAAALDDPHLRLFVRDESGGYVEAAGSAAPGRAPARAITTVGPDGQPLAVLAHDPFLFECGQQRRLAAAVLLTEHLFPLRSANLAYLHRLHMHDLQDIERRTRDQIRSDLHDGPQHQLSLLQGLIGQARQHLSDSDSQRLLPHIAEVLQQTVRDLREVIDGIYPSALPAIGLRAALETLMRRSPVSLHIDEPPVRWSDRLEYELYLIVSEAVGNARKHANPSRIDIRIRQRDGHVIAEVSDDGQGLDGSTREGTGFKNMRGRAAVLGGTLSIHPRPGGGTTVRAELPCAS